MAAPCRSWGVPLLWAAWAMVPGTVGNFKVHLIHTLTKHVQLLSAAWDETRSPQGLWATLELHFISYTIKHSQNTPNYSEKLELELIKLMLLDLEWFNPYLQTIVLYPVQVAAINTKYHCSVELIYSTCLVGCLVRSSSITYDGLCWVSFLGQLAIVCRKATLPDNGNGNQWQRRKWQRQSKDATAGYEKMLWQYSCGIVTCLYERKLKQCLSI